MIAPSGALRRLAVSGPPAVLILAAVSACLMIQRPGHDWGDDFALSIRQAQGVIHGNMSDVVADNRFSLARSSWHTFSPQAYPWGWPLLMAPVVATFGLDYTPLKWLCTGCFAVFLIALYGIVDRRAGRVAALAVTALIGFSGPFVGWTDTVLSEMPYLAAVGLCLWWLDRCRLAGGAPGATETPPARSCDSANCSPMPIRSTHQPPTSLPGRAASPVARPTRFPPSSLISRYWRPMVLGLLVALAVSIRREGLALVVAVVVSRSILVVATSDEDAEPTATAAGRSRRLRARRSRRLAVELGIPLGVAAIATLLLELATPGPFATGYPGTGPSRVLGNLRWFAIPLAEQIGVKDAGEPTRSLLGASVVGDFLFVGFFVLALVGMIRCVRNRPSADAPIAAFVIMTAGSVLVLPFHEGRYLMSITPFLAAFAAQSTRRFHAAGSVGRARVVAADPGLAVARRGPSAGPGLAPSIGVALVVVLAVAAFTDTQRRVIDTFRTGHRTVWGPQSETSTEMFAIVDSRVGAEDVIAFQRARAMTLYTERRAVQVLDIADLLAVADWYVRVKDPDDYSQVPLAEPQASALGIRLNWENEAFELWKLPDG